MQKQKSLGFTLVSLMVALGVVLVLAVGVL